MFPSNVPLRDDLSRAAGRVVRQPAGHLIIYNRDNRRVLATDPEGHPLHECEWATTPSGTIRLKWARVRLDWGQWVGIKPAGLVNATVLDLTRKPGWHYLQTDDLRHMAAQALRVPLDEVRFFYNDDDLRIAPDGTASIRHKKDALYVLGDGTFGQAQFMACMGAMHWEQIDFLPVVELFQSLLPGTGSATLELIRGLYDDQNQDQPSPRVLRYRGIPTYPSEAAYRLFSAFFSPQAPGGADPFSIFMDPSRSYQVAWLPNSDPPRRYFLESENLCVTVKGQTVQKVTVADDGTGLSYVESIPPRIAPCERMVGVEGTQLILVDRDQRRCLSIGRKLGSVNQRPIPTSVSAPVGWRLLFEGGPPSVEPAQAFSAVLLYPENEREISEASTQPFVSDYLQDLLEQAPPLAEHWRRSSQVLIDQLDTAMTGCVGIDRPRTYTILFQTPALAQKQAQMLWNQFAGAGRLEWLRQVRIMASASHRKEAYAARYDLIVAWIPFDHYDALPHLEERAGAIAQALAPGGLAFVVGPDRLGPLLEGRGLRILKQEFVEDLPTVSMHRSILPEARLKPGLTLFHVTVR